MEYHLYPPFLVVPEEPSFDEAWESFCCKALMLMEGRNDIVRRTPPESGVDLYCDASKTAYQCKSVESGRAGGFDAPKAIASYQKAQEVKSDLGWETYVLCTNVDVTGTAETKLRDAAPDIVIRSRAYWHMACEKFPGAVARNFRHLVSIPQDRAMNATQTGFANRYADEVRDLMGRSPAKLFLYSHQHDRVYTLPVSLDVKTGDLVRVLVTLFGLPKNLSRAERGLKVLLSHGLALDGADMPPERTLRENGVGEQSLLTFSTQTQIITPRGQLTTRHLSRQVLAGTAFPPEIADEVIAMCAEAFSGAFASFDGSVPTTDATN